MEKVFTALKSAEYWIIPVAVFGAIIGSFLNVVIFRLPRGLSVNRPRWSFCPHCRARIQPFHNVPIFGWLFLRGRCRDCRRPIAMVYPLVECASVLLFIMVWDAMFVARVLPGIGHPVADWALAIAYLMLFAGLLATAVMDIEAYTIDIRLCMVTMFVGVLCHAVWGAPASSVVAASAGVRPSAMPQALGLLPPSLGVIGSAMGIAWLLTVLVATRWLRRDVSQEEGDEASSPSDDLPWQAAESPDQTAYLNTAGQRFRPLPILLFLALVVGLLLWQRFAPSRRFDLPLTAGALRGLLACAVFMFLLMLSSLVRREADEQIIEEITAESAGARTMVLGELAWFIPVVLVGVSLFLFLRLSGRLDAGYGELLDLGASHAGWLNHLEGACRSIAAMVLAAALGWTVRILGTLTFGKEAFGTGDIFIMAAIGAVLGFWAVVFSFFLAAVLALVGTVVTMLRKSSRAIPFGPWLALGAFVELWLHAGLLRWFAPAGKLLWSILSGHPLWLTGA